MLLLMRHLLQSNDISNTWYFLHSSMIPTSLKLYINKGLVLIAYVLPVSSISPSFLKDLDSKVENKIVWKFGILSFVYFQGWDMAVFNWIELNWITLFKVSYVILKLHNSSHLLKVCLNNANRPKLTMIIKIKIKKQ